LKQAQYQLARKVYIHEQDSGESGGCSRLEGYSKIITRGSDQGLVTSGTHISIYTLKEGRPSSISQTSATDPDAAARVVFKASPICKLTTLDLCIPCRSLC